MLKILMGLKGSGKTKQFIEWVNDAVNSESGSVICINKDNRLMYDLKKDVRLIDTEQYTIKDFEMFYGFLCGVISQNFDITHIFIDSILKVVPETIDALDAFIPQLEALSEKFNVKFSLTISEDINSATANIKKYM